MKRSNPTSSNNRGPHYDLAHCTGPNATAIKQSAARATEREIEELKAIRAENDAPASHQARATERQEAPAQPHERYPEIAAASAAAAIRASSATPRQPTEQPAPDKAGVYGLRAEDPEAVPGEPSIEAPVFALGDIEHNRAVWAEAHAKITQARLDWTRQEILKLRAALNTAEPGMRAAEKLRTMVLKDLSDLRAMALRNARRGKPALLRLILLATKPPKAPR